MKRKREGREKGIKIGGEGVNDFNGKQEGLEKHKGWSQMKIHSNVVSLGNIHTKDLSLGAISSQINPFPFSSKLQPWFPLIICILVPLLDSLVESNARLF